MDTRDLLEKADRKLFKVRSVDPADCPLSNIIPKIKETKYHLRDRTAIFKNVFLIGLLLEVIFLSIFRLPFVDVYDIVLSQEE